MATQPGGGPPPNANKISIVTKSEIRYEGTLYHINPQDQSITLSNVKSFGTEGRRPGNELASSPQIHPYIIFRGTDIKDLKVLEENKGEPTQQIQTVETISNEAKQTQIQPTQPKETESKDIKMKGDNQVDFDFANMQEKFEKFQSEHKTSDVKVKSYVSNDFFDSLSTSTADKTREVPFDRIAQKKVDKETFGSEYVDNASHRGGRGGRGGHRGGRGGGHYRGGYNKNYQGGGGHYQGGGGHYQGGQNKNYGDRQNNYQGGQNNYQGGQNRNYGGGYQGGRKYGGGQGNYGGHQGGYGGGQGGQGGQGYERKYEGGQGKYGGNYQGGYGGGQGGQGGQEGQGGQSGYNQGPKYYKTYQSVENNQNQ